MQRFLQRYKQIRIPFNLVQMTYETPLPTEKSLSASLYNYQKCLDIVERGTLPHLTEETTCSTTH
jgi:hypothetical protein